MELPYEREAMRGNLMPDGLRLHDQSAFQALRNLYERYKRGAITKEDASAEKRLIIAQRNREESSFEQSRKNILLHAKLWKKIEAAGNRYGRERTIENADAFYQAVYGCTLKEPDDGGEHGEEKL